MRIGPARGHERGFTTMEFLIAGFLAFIVVLALGRVILVNQQSWERGRDKTELQQNATEVLEWMARSVRAARTLNVVSSSEFRTYDETGALVHTYRRVAVSGVNRLQQDGTDLVDRLCTQFVVVPNADTTTVRLTLELEDNSGNRVGAETRASIRNQAFEF